MANRRDHRVFEEFRRALGTFGVADHHVPLLHTVGDRPWTVPEIAAPPRQARSLPRTRAEWWKGVLGAAVKAGIASAVLGVIGAVIVKLL